MIPINLTLKNFMSYGPEGETLPFQEIHVACLSGDNGNGKSALLDAMTWALWGRTRASSVGTVSEDDLIRAGSDEMEVRFEFDLDDRRYRVVRKRKRGKSAASDWQFAQQTESGDYASVGGGSQRETARLIVDLLSMEYETFLNSAYLQQGSADEFTRQTPMKRKAILSEILGLDRYDQLEARAREFYKDRKQQADELDSQIKMLASQAARRPGYVEQLDEVRVQVSAFETRVSEQEQRASELNKRRAQLDMVAESCRETLAANRRAEAEIAQRDTERIAKLERLRALQETIDRKQVILSDYAAYQDAQKRRDQLDPEIERLNAVSRDLETTIAAIELEETRLKNELRLLENDLRAVEKRRVQVGLLETQLAALAVDLQAAPRVEQEMAAVDLELQQAREEFTNLRTRNEAVKESLVEIEEVLVLLARPHASCPVCESDISGKRHETVTAKQEAKRDRLLAEQKTLVAEGRSKKIEADAAQAKLNDLTARRQDLTAKGSRRQELLAQRDALISEGVDVEAACAQVERLATMLTKGEFAMPKRIHKQRLERELVRLALVKPEYETARATITRLAGTDKRYHQLQDAELNWDQEVADRDRLERDLSARRKELAAGVAKAGALSESLAQYETIKREAAEIEAERGRLQSELNALRVREGAVLSYIGSCDEAVEEGKVRTAEFRKVDQERWVYNHLMNAFGKKGLQALIIENAIPDLEEEANGLLSKMTDNAMQVRFETTRSAKSGGHEIETLDIRVQDDAGMRPYELFSGGEAFRVNFAIRIALSRLLARRSGAKLQTLILDEGFGTQDGKGREKLVEVIDTIKADFEKILVITHVEDLKDAFSQRIEVTKDGSGSHIHLV